MFALCDFAALAQQADQDQRKYLYDADPNCQHNIMLLWSGVKCSKCPGWFCL